MLFRKAIYLFYIEHSDIKYLNNDLPIIICLLLSIISNGSCNM